MILLNVATWIALLCVFQGEICIAVQQQKHKKLKCRTRFTTARPTRENVVSILFGTAKGGDNDVGQANISFNHGECADTILFDCFIISYCIL